MSNGWMSTFVVRHMGSSHGYGSVDEYEVDYVALGEVDDRTLTGIHKHANEMVAGTHYTAFGPRIRSSRRGAATLLPRGNEYAQRFEVTKVTFFITTATPSTD